jgi:phosphate starvation-inducible PhoH-like protein
VVVGSGSSGSGKSFVACVHAANEFLKGNYRQIVLLRPVEPVSGKTLGFRPGTALDKMQEAYQSMYEPLKVVFGSQHFDYLLEKGDIVPCAIEMVRGRSFYRSIIIVDEGSNCDVKTMKTLVSRIGEGSQLIICGDQASWQQDIKGDSGLTWLLDVVHQVRKDDPSWLNVEDKHNLYNEIGFVKFTKDDVVRSGISSLFVKIFDEYE